MQNFELFTKFCICILMFWIAQKSTISLLDSNLRPRLRWTLHHPPKRFQKARIGHGESSWQDLKLYCPKGPWERKSFGKGGHNCPSRCALSWCAQRPEWYITYWKINIKQNTFKINREISRKRLLPKNFGKIVFIEQKSSPFLPYYRLFHRTEGYLDL